jgi:hypothetical protein
LNNGAKRGVLHVENDRGRVFFHLDGGRVAGVSASGVDPAELTASLPESLASLAPVLDLTVTGQAGGQLGGILELLDRKVLNPRLLSRLLRHQAALLTLRCFTERQNEFRFESKRTLSPLHQKVPLGISVLALLIEGAMHCDESLLPADDPRQVYVRRLIRGQNLDRAGVSAQHMKLFGLLQQARSVDELTGPMDAGRDELRRALYALTLADLVEVQQRRETRTIIVFEPDLAGAQGLRELREHDSGRYCCKLVRDHLALRLLLRRADPDAFVCGIDNEAAPAVLRDVHKTTLGRGGRTKFVGFIAPERNQGGVAAWSKRVGAELDAVVDGPLTKESLFAALDDLFTAGEKADALPPAVPAVVAAAVHPTHSEGVTQSC